MSLKFTSKNTLKRIFTRLSEIFVKKNDIVDNVTSTDTDKPLSANQGKVLNESISTLQSHTEDTSIHIPSGGSEGQLLRCNKDGTSEWASVSATSAEKDADGNIITDTYATKSEIIPNNDTAASYDVGVEGPGWYRIAKFVSTSYESKGSTTNSCQLFIKRVYSNNNNEYHEVKLSSVYGKSKLVSGTNLSNEQYITNIRHTVDTTNNVAYIEIYYTGTKTNPVTLIINNGRCIYNKYWECIEPEFTEETVDGVTVYSKLDIPANVTSELKADLKEYNVPLIDDSYGDFNEYLDIGIYTFGTNSGMANTSNAPTDKAGTLIVTDYTGGSKSMSEIYAYRVQEFYTHDNSGVYKRAFHTNNGELNVGEWVKDVVPSDITKTYLPLTGGKLTGDVYQPISPANNTLGSNGTLPVSSSEMYISDIVELKKYKTYLGAMTHNGTWYNLISTRHRNGAGDGSQYGMYLRSTLITGGNLTWGKQTNTTWQAERTILDSSNYGSYAVPTITTFQTFVGTGWYRIALTDKVNTCTSFILSIDRDYNTNHSESHTFLINYSHYLCRIVELNAAINNRLFTDIRFVVNNDGAAHQHPAYIDLYYNSSNSNNAILTISRNIGRCDWRFQTATISEIPSGHTAFSFSTASKSGSKFNKVEVDDNIEFTDSGTSFRGIGGKCSGNDYWRVGGAGTSADNAGYMELATADDATEPIYVRQYIGAFATLKRTLTLLDGSGNTDLPGSLYMSGKPAFTQETGSQTAYQSANQSDTTTRAFGIGTNSTMYNNSTILRGYYIYLNPYYRVSSSATIGIASDEKVKTFSDDIQTDEDKLVKLFDLIKPKSYNYNYSHSDNLNIGFSAQDIEKAMIELDIDPEKYGILNIRYNHMLSRGDNLEDSKFYTKFYEISYNDLFSLSLLKMNVMEKQHVARLESLEERLTTLENK